MPTAAESPITLLQLRNLELKLGRKPTPSMVALLQETVWGTPGAMRYMHVNTAQKLTDLPDPWFLYMERDGETIGVLCLDHRVIAGVDAFYIRYFSFAESLRRKVSADDGAPAPASRGQGMFKRFASQFFEDPKALLEAVGVQRAVFYAYVEAENARSQDMVAQMGLRPCGGFSTTLFSRLWVRPRARVRQAQPHEHAGLRERLRETYASHTFWVEHGLMYRGEYYVLEIDGEVVAGCQGHPITWRIVEIPGRGGRLMMRFLPHLPLISRLFNPEQFRFTAIEGLWVRGGRYDLVQELLEGVLAQQQQHVAILWMSPQSPVAQGLQGRLSLGPLRRFKQDVPAMVAMRAYGLTPDETARWEAGPPYICAFDGT